MVNTGTCLYRLNSILCVYIRVISRIEPGTKYIYGYNTHVSMVFIYGVFKYTGMALCAGCALVRWDDKRNVIL